MRGEAYHGQRVTFTCTIVANSDVILTWRSAQYIDGNLQFKPADPEGQNITDSQNPTTVATLINTTRSSNGEITVVSELQLTASVLYPTSRVRCRANGREFEPVIIVFRKSDINWISSCKT